MFDNNAKIKLKHGKYVFITLIFVYNSSELVHLLPLSLTPWPFKPLPGLFCLNIFIGCAQKKGWYNKPRIFSLPVSSYFQSLQLPPTWDGRRWVKRFGPGDPHTPAALLSALQVSPLTPNFQTSYYFLPTRWYRWLLGLFLRFGVSLAVFLCLIGPGT